MNNVSTMLRTALSKPLIIMMAAIAVVPTSASARDTQITVDLSSPTGSMEPIWAWLGYDEPNYTYMSEGKRLLTEFAEASRTPVYVRAHNLLTTGDGTPALKWGSTNAYTEDNDGNPVYDWTITDSIFDTYIERGMHPLVQIGFMPEALSTHPQPYRHSWSPGAPYNEIFTGWAYPPNDYDKWRELVYQWARHCKERYGDDEVSQWYWEVWNEPNLYLQGSIEDYCRMFDYAVDGLHRALPDAIVGGPHSTGPGGRGAREYLRRFIDHCLNGTNYATGEKGTPIGYIGFHAKGAPHINGDEITMGIRSQLNDVRRGFEVVASYPQLSHIPVIIGEFDPEGCAACSTEFNPEFDYRNGTVYSSTVAATFARLYELARKYDVNLKGAVNWAFVFENTPWFAGFREMSTNGVDKPVLNVFRMFGLMGGNLVKATSTDMLPLDSICDKGVRDTPDIGVLASRQNDEAAIMTWNYHDNTSRNVPDSPVTLTINGCDAKRALVSHYRIDSDYSNSYEAWKRMGSPAAPDAWQIEELKRSGQLQLYTSPQWVDVKDGVIKLSYDLPRQAVSLIKVEW